VEWTQVFDGTGWMSHKDPDKAAGTLRTVQGRPLCRTPTRGAGARMGRASMVVGARPSAPRPLEAGCRSVVVSGAGAADAGRHHFTEVTGPTE
jgi:hypothetical protein